MGFSCGHENEYSEEYLEATYERENEPKHKRVRSSTGFLHLLR